ncbi:MAG: cellulose binding domain-containing protein [Anaerolineae bacterium]|nr:cellulose binding domain-containing protein [Anaerolineae bacterium]
MKLQYKIVVVVMLVAAVAGLALAMGRPAAAFEDSPIGYASVNGATTGGAGGTTVTVTSGDALQAAIDNKGSQPLTINVQGHLTYGGGRIVIKDVSDISIIGVGSTAELDGFGLTLRRASNIIIRNLKIHHVDTEDKDAIQLTEDCHHIWVDHNELYSDLDHDKDYYDGLLDITHACDYITVSWNVFHTHYKASLIGNSDDNASEDQGHFLVTYHHNYFYDVNSRLPSNRFGRVHVYNNYYRNVATSAISSRMGACTRIERNYFDNVQDPVMTDQSDELGSVQLIDNQFVNSSSYDTSPTCSLSVPYSYSADAVSSVPSIVASGAGVGKLDGTPPTVVPPTSVPPTSVPPTSVPPTSSVPGIYQAEYAVLGGDVAVETEHGGYAGTGYVNFPSDGGYVEYQNVDGGTGGGRTLQFRFALGADGTRTGQLTVNGASQNITFQPTGAWDSWAILEVAVNLNTGTSNTVRLSSTGEDLANQDQLQIAGGITPTTVPPTSVPPTSMPPTSVPPTSVPPTSVPGIYQAEYAVLGGGVAVETEHGGYAGAGYVNFPADGGYVEYQNVDGGTGGSRTLQFRFALGADSARTGQLTVNGASQNITFQPTGTWDSWTILDIAVNLNAGTNNTVRLQSTGQDLANQDQMEVVGGTTPTTIPPTSVPPTSVPPTSVPPTTGPGGCVVNYVIQNDWGSGATVSVTIQNNGASTINGWTLTWTFPGSQQISALWNASFSQSGASVSVSDAGWNATIGANGGTAGFGFNLVYSGTNAEPTDFVLNGTACQSQ